jgi:MFS family permease
MFVTVVHIIMPVPMLNILNGGKHAADSTDLQEFMIMPLGAETFAHALRMCSDIYHALKKLLQGKDLNVNIGDEGGFAPSLGALLAGWISPANSALASGMTLMVMFVSRVLDGLTGGNISVAQAYITDVTDEQNRARGLGMIGAAFGLGFIIGPAAGGALSQWGYSIPAFVATAVSLINWLAIFFFLPEGAELQSFEDSMVGDMLDLTKGVFQQEVVISKRVCLHRKASLSDSFINIIQYGPLFDRQHGCFFLRS